MKKALRILISILMTFPLWGCTQKSPVTVDLSSVVFTGLFVGTAEAMTEEDTITIYPGESEILRTGIKIDQWTTVEKEDKKIPEAWYILLDEDGNAYQFSQYGKMLQIAITKKGYAPAFYEVELKINDVISGIIAKIKQSISNKNAITATTFITGDTRPGHPAAEYGSFTMNKSMSERVVTVSKVESWVLTNEEIKSYETFPYELSLAVLNTISLYFHMTDGAAKVYVYRGGVYYIYAITREVYNAVRNELLAIRAEVMPAPGNIVTDAIYTTVTIDPGIDAPSILKPVTLSLFEGQSELAKSYMQMDQWVKLSSSYDLNKMTKTLILKDTQGYTTSIGYVDYLPMAIITKEDDAQFKEVYGIPNNLRVITWALSVNWDAAVPESAILNFVPTHLEIFDGTNELGEPIYRDIDLDSIQSAELMEQLHTNIWRIDPESAWIGHYGWFVDFVVSDNAGNKIIIVGQDRPSVTTIWIQGPLAGTNDDYFFYTSTKNFDSLKAHITSTYPKP